MSLTYTFKSFTSTSSLAVAVILTTCKPVLVYRVRLGGESVIVIASAGIVNTLRIITTTASRLIGYHPRREFVLLNSEENPLQREYWLDPHRFVQQYRRRLQQLRNYQDQA